jgi:hypothetical protein
VPVARKSAKHNFFTIPLPNGEIPSPALLVGSLHYCTTDINIGTVDWFNLNVNYFNELKTTEAVGLATTTEDSDVQSEVKVHFIYRMRLTTQTEMEY